MVRRRSEPPVRVKRNLLREKTAGADYPRCRSLLERGKAQSQKLKVREDVHADRSLYSERARSEGGVGGYDSGIHFETVHSGPLPTLNPAGRTDSRSARFNVRWRWRAGSGRSAIALCALSADRAATMICAPRRASPSAMKKPMPLAAPVTMMDCPSSRALCIATFLFRCADVTESLSGHQFVGGLGSRFFADCYRRLDQGRHLRQPLAGLGVCPHEGMRGATAGRCLAGLGFAVR